MWSTNRTEPLCRTRKSFQEIYAEHGDQAYRTVMDKEYIDPCLNIEKIQIDYIEEDIPSVDANTDDDKEKTKDNKHRVLELSTNIRSGDDQWFAEVPRWPLDNLYV